MIRLGETEFWLDPGAGGWTLLRVGGTGRGRRTQAFGPFTSPRHALQQRQVRRATWRWGRSRRRPKKTCRRNPRRYANV